MQSFVLYDISMNVTMNEGDEPVVLFKLSSNRKHVLLLSCHYDKNEEISKKTLKIMNKNFIYGSNSNKKK